jgi:hypothetical protein
MHGLVLTYSDIFDQEPPDLDEVIARIPSKIAIMYFSFLCSELHLAPSDSEVQKRLIERIINRQSNIVQNSIRSKYERLSQSAPTILLDTCTAMELMNRVMQNYNGSEAPDTNPTDELNILMAILIVNDKFNTNHRFEGSTNLFETFCSMTWPVHIFSTELRLKKNHFHEVYRGIKFAQHIENSPEFRPAFKALFPEIDEPCYLYPSNVFYLYGKTGFNKDTSTFYSWFSFNVEKDIKYTLPWILSHTNITQPGYIANDYRSLRSFPLIKLSEDRYSVVNWNFILDKMFNGLIFDLFEKSGISDPTSAIYDVRYSNLPGFKSAISGMFSENLCIDLFRSALSDYEIEEGDDNALNNQDLYLRKNNKIGFIEHKDPLFTKKADYHSIKKVLDSKLINDQGATQLVELIRKFKEDYLYIEGGLGQHYTEDQLVVYPIIVVTDSAFALTGMEDYVNNAFQEKLEEIGELPFIVNRLVIIDLYSLMNLHDPIALGEKDFFELLDAYFIEKNTLIETSRKPGASTSDISAQFQGFSELVGYKNRPVDPTQNIEGTLKYKMFEELKRLGMSDH